MFEYLGPERVLSARISFPLLFEVAGTWSSCPCQRNRAVIFIAIHNFRLYTLKLDMEYGGVSVPSVNVESITRLNLKPNGYIGEGAEVGKALNFVLYVALQEASIQKVLN